MPPSTLALLLITHNSARWLPDFFATWHATLAQSHLAQNPAPAIVIADNASTDNTLQLAAQLAPEAQILPLPNLGYGSAANHAANVAPSAKWLLLCNPDLTFPSNFAPTFLDPVLDSLRAEPLWQCGACIAPRLLNPDGSPQPSIGNFPTIRALLADQLRTPHLRKYIHPQPTTPSLVDWASGACLLLRRDAFDSVAGFDPNFFLYVEEVDLQRRLWNAGHQTWFAPEATVTNHNPNANRPPTPAIQLHSARGLLRYFAKHGSPLQLLAYRLLALASRRLPPREALASRQRLTI